MDRLRFYRQIWVLDFEFKSDEGERPAVHCLAARELRSGCTLKLWVDELERGRPPFSIGPDVLLVAYASAAEWSCFLQLGWPQPQRVVDLYVEFRNLTNGLKIDGQFRTAPKLLESMSFYRLDAMAAGEKDELRALAIRGGPFTPEERRSLKDYCLEDVDATAELFRAMLPHLDLPRAMLRARYMWAIAMMEHNGIPVDGEMLTRLRSSWDVIKNLLVEEVDEDFGVYDGTRFCMDKFAEFLNKHKIPWPRTEKGILTTSDDVFHDMSKCYPIVRPLHDLRHTLGQLRLESIPLGRDGYSRCWLAPFTSKTGRNQPSSSRFLFSPSCWLRSIIKPPPGQSIAYCDFARQEIGIGAALSGDEGLQAAYQADDCYLVFAKSAGAVPMDATKQTHPEERAVFKTAMLGIAYGMTPYGLRHRINQPFIVARELIEAHRSAYARFWKWAQAAVDYGLLRGHIQTPFLWQRYTRYDRPRSLLNWPIQACGAEMLRLACCLIVERGVKLCAPVHDAVLIEAPTADIEDAVRVTHESMKEASRVALRGFEVGADAQIVNYPERYVDGRGVLMWEKIQKLLRRAESQVRVA